MPPEAERYGPEGRPAEEEAAAGAPCGRRVLPEAATPSLAWADGDESERAADGPGEGGRLLAADERPERAGCARIAIKLKPGVTSKFQKRKDRLVEALRPPRFIIVMIVIMVALQLGGPEGLRARLEWAPGAWWRRPWRLLSYGLVHAGAAHLALNALVALAVGWRLEREQGWARVAAVWAGGVAAGALGAGALQPRVRVVGASAAVYALLTAHLPNVCLRFGHVPLWWFRPLSVVVLAASECCWALLRAPEERAGGSLVAWAAHVCGAAVGVPLGFLVFTGENISKIHVRACRMVSMFLLATAVCGTGAYYALWYDANPYT